MDCLPSSTPERDDDIDKMLSELSDIQERVSALEEKFAVTFNSMATRKENCQLAPTTDKFALDMLIRAIAAGFTDTRFVRCPDDYYDWELSKRRAFLNAPSTKHLTKSIVFENTRHEGPCHSKLLCEARYVCCVVPYGCGVDTDEVRRLVRESGSNGCVPPLSKYNFRLAGDCVDITGYEPNAVTPLGIKTPMPVLLDVEITRLYPPTFWLGGGQVSLKWFVHLHEFLKHFQPVVSSIATTTPTST